MSDGSSKLIAIDEETKHQIMHPCRFGKANRATYETFDPGAQIDVLAFDLLRMGFVNRVLLGIEMALVTNGVSLLHTRQSGSLNFAHFVARTIWRRRSVSPRRGRAHRLQRRAPLQGLLVPMATTFDLRHTARN